MTKATVNKQTWKKLIKRNLNRNFVQTFISYLKCQIKNKSESYKYFYDVPHIMLRKYVYIWKKSPSDYV